METREARDATTKSGDTRPAEFSVNRYEANEHTSLYTKPFLKSVESIDLGDTSDSSSNFSDQEDESSMRKDAREGRLKTSSKPINIPKVKVSSVDIDETSRRRFQRGSLSPTSSAGDTIFNSPVLPRPSNDFSHVMIKLRHRGGNIQRVRSCDNVEDSDGESCISSLSGTAISSSVPEARITKGRRTVRFDEATITLTAELGESAARFRAQWRKKRSASNTNRFGESKNISITHVDGEVDSPQLQRTDVAGEKSIFDICNYSSYGRYT